MNCPDEEEKFAQLCNVLPPRLAETIFVVVVHF